MSDVTDRSAVEQVEAAIKGLVIAAWDRGFAAGKDGERIRVSPDEHQTRATILTLVSALEQRAEEAERELIEVRREVERLRGEVLPFFRSVIQSGEEWTDLCERKYREAIGQALARDEKGKRRGVMYVCGYCGGLRQGAHGNDEQETMERLLRVAEVNAEVNASVVARCTETIRDRDARAAMAAYISHPATGLTFLRHGVPEDEQAVVVARAAYNMADAMQAERERRKGEE